MEDLSKVCSRCKVRKPLSRYAKRSSRKSGVQSWCKDCHHEHKKLNPGKPRNFPPSTKPKICTECKVTKSADEFYPNKNAATGLSSYCKPCWNRTIKRRYYDKEYAAKRKKIYVAKHKDKVIQAGKDYYLSNKSVIRRKAQEKDLVLKYDLSREQYLKMFSDQNFQCAVCFGEVVPFTRNAHVDHCHTTGKVRGILCKPCNQGLGFFRDDQIRLLNAVTYLKNSLKENQSGCIPKSDNETREVPSQNAIRSTGSQIPQSERFSTNGQDRK